MTTNIEEYQMTNKWEAGKVVEARIRVALESHADYEKLHKHISFSVKVIRQDYSFDVTRVYAGGWLWGGRSGTNKSFIQSKRDKAIETSRAVDFILEKAREVARGYAIYESKVAKEHRSQVLADTLKDEMGLDHMPSIYVRSTSLEGKVEVSYKRDLTVEEAREVIKALKALNA